DRAVGHDVEEALVIRDDHAGAMPLQLLAAVHLDPPPHHAGQAAAEDFSVNVESLAVAGGEEEPDDSRRRAEHEPDSSDDEAEQEVKPLRDPGHRVSDSRSRCLYQI